jgi:hypothetical protein
MASSGTANAAVLDSAELKAVKAGGLIREDVMNKIFDISKIPLPFTDMVGSTSAKQEYIEWTKDELSTPNIANAVIDGSDISGNDAKTGERVGNHHQISIKAVQVSYRADASDTIGRAKELAYQLMRRQQELRRDVEAIALGNQASVADNGTTIAGKVGTLCTWLKTNAKGSSSQGFDLNTKLTVAATPATAVALTEANLRDTIQSVYQNGGDASVMMTTPAVIAKFSQYMIKSAGATAQIHTEVDGRSKEPVTALGTVNVFVTDFGTIRAVPNRLQQTYDDATPTTPKKASTVFILDPSYISLCYLKGYQTDELAKTGLSEKRVMSVDWSLIVHTEKAHGMIFGVDGSVAMTA